MSGTMAETTSTTVEEVLLEEGAEAGDQGVVAKNAASAYVDPDEGVLSKYISKPFQIARYQALVSDERVLGNSLNAVRFAVFADTFNARILQPNYAIMVSPDTHEDSFESTAPFDFSSATYFIPMTAMLGMAIASAVTGKLSDRIGRKPVITFCLAASMVGSAVKWSLRGTFWGFCIANFFNGLVSGSLPVALAYISDVFVSPSTKSKQFGIAVSFLIVGNSTGGIIAILMEAEGLFAPLWVGVAIMAIATLVAVVFMVEPGQLQIAPTADEDEQEEQKGPETIDQGTMYHILAGAMADVFGSKALFPLCLSPLAFNAFYRDFVDRGEEPIMSLTAYKWLSVLVALTVLPATLMSPTIFNKLGLAGGCVLANFITGLLTIALLLIGSVEPTSTGYFAGFVAFMYIGFPFTVFSQLVSAPPRGLFGNYPLAKTRLTHPMVSYRILVD
jgi:MFS family permease